MNPPVRPEPVEGPLTTVIPASRTVIPASRTVIPAKAGIQSAPLPPLRSPRPLR
jgi:hypothetical protein